MSGLLLDTHVWVWSMFDDPRLSATARAEMEQATALYVSPLSLFELAQKVRLGEWPVMEPNVDGLVERLTADGAELAPLTASICLLAGSLDWPHRDPFDRMIAATALRMELPPVTADSVFGALPADLRRV